MKVGIVGLGYVGLPLAVAFAEAGCDVVGARRRPGQGRARCARAARTSRTSRTRGSRAALERCTFTTRYVELHEADAILVCVPTPLTRNREPDLGPLLSASRSLAGVIRRGQTIVLESTTFPGTTREHLVPLLEESGLQRGRGLRAGVLARARRPGPHRLHAAQHAEGRRRADRGLHRGRRRRLRAGLRRDRAASPRPRSPSSRSCSRTSSARSTSRSSTRWRCSPTAWASTSGRSSTPPRPSPTASCRFEPGPGHGRPLPAGRPVLPDLEGARVRPLDRVHRARRQGQPADALLLPREGRARAQRRRQAGQRLAHPGRSASPTRPASATCASHRR